MVGALSLNTRSPLGEKADAMGSRALLQPPDRNQGGMMGRNP